mmetsp:Transcript_69654/g.175443  ORF Transcript_69654/g.175443 Transcript_69654/m.175443 type:complete len:294 (-) Transcript_69654:329-1210(-)
MVLSAAPTLARAPMLVTHSSATSGSNPSGCRPRRKPRRRRRPRRRSLLNPSSHTPSLWGRPCRLRPRRRRRRGRLWRRAARRCTTSSSAPCCCSRAAAACWWRCRRTRAVRTSRMPSGPVQAAWQRPDAVTVRQRPSTSAATWSTSRGLRCSRRRFFAICNSMAGRCLKLPWSSVRSWHSISGLSAATSDLSSRSSPSRPPRTRRSSERPVSGPQASRPREAADAAAGATPRCMTRSRSATSSPPRRASTPRGASSARRRSWRAPGASWSRSRSMQGAGPLSSDSTATRAPSG